MGFFKWFRSLFGTFNDRFLREAWDIVEKINSFEHEFCSKDQEYLLQSSAIFREQIKHGRSLDLILPEAFAIVREASKRALGLRLFDEQLIGGIALHRGMIAEMKTGEGKTLVVSLAAYLNALSGNGVHVATVNDYLANRDVNWMGPIYQMLGLSAGCIITSSSNEERQVAYECDITYGVGSEFGFDYLRDGLSKRASDVVRKKFLNYAIIDEVDNTLIDEARTPLIISSPSHNDQALYVISDAVVKTLNEEHFEINVHDNTVSLTESGYEYLEEFVSQNKFLTNLSLYESEHLLFMHAVNQSLRANHLIAKDKEYVVINGEVKIVHELTGRIAEGRRFSDGLHQAIEAKERVKICEEHRAIASITLACYFKMYKKMSGVSGTVVTERLEFGSVYGVDVCEIPTHLPIKRVDDNDAIYVTAKERNSAVMQLIKERHEVGQPILIGVTSVEQSEAMSVLLKENKLPHNVLNAKNHTKEAAIIAEAGAFGAITIATSMAGRGTDIKLGGSGGVMWSTDPEFKEKIKILKEENRKKTIDAGGLLVIGAGRHTSIRIDNQLRGRSGRQGDIGRSKFFLSLEDDIMKIMGSDKIKSVLKTFGGAEDNDVIEHPWITKAIAKAQGKIEARNFEIRKALHEFDQVLNRQRSAAFDLRFSILMSDRNELNEIIKQMIVFVNKNIMRSIKSNSAESKRLVKLIYNATIEEFLKEIIEFDGVTDAEADGSVSKCFEMIIAGINSFGPDSSNEMIKRIMLSHIDFFWFRYLELIDEAKININGVAQASNRDPINEFKQRALKFFGDFLLESKASILGGFIRMSIDEKISSMHQQSEEFEI